VLPLVQANFTQRTLDCSETIRRQGSGETDETSEEEPYVSVPGAGLSRTSILEQSSRIEQDIMEAGNDAADPGRPELSGTPVSILSPSVPGTSGSSASFLTLNNLDAKPRLRGGPPGSVVGLREGSGSGVGFGTQSRSREMLCGRDGELSHVMDGWVHG
jgi:hypothetical protein